MAADESTVTSCSRGHLHTARIGSGPERSSCRAAIVNGTVYWGTGYHTEDFGLGYNGDSNKLYAFTLNGQVQAAYHQALLTLLRES